MKTVCCFCVVAWSALVTAPTARGQELPKPGPEHEVLKKMEGTWDLTMKAGDLESKGTVVYKMDLNGLWLSGKMESDFGGVKFSGRGMDTYDAASKKYVAVWIDSMSTRPLVMEGTYDKGTKTLTMTGEGPGMDGKPTKFRTVSKMPDDNTINFSMYMGDMKDPAFTIVYKRKK